METPLAPGVRHEFTASPTRPKACGMANLLTALRIALIVPFAAAFLAGGEAGRWAAFGIFLIAALTDFADGRVARARGETSALGAALDPIADKALAATALLLLAASGDVAGPHLVPAIAILVREFVVSGLREAAAGRGDVPVTALSKLKTVVQFAALAALTAPLVIAQTIGAALLWVAGLLTLWTGLAHARSAVEALQKTS